MNQWLNRSHPQTLQAGVILGYISAVFGLLDTGGQLLLLLVYLGLGAGAFVTANNKRWGYILLAVCACLAAFFRIYPLVAGVLDTDPLRFTLARLNSTVFPAALAVAVLHTQSREYQKAWFE
jgi:predicted permease